MVEMVVNTDAELQDGAYGGHWSPQCTGTRVREGVEVGSIRTCCDIQKKLHSTQ